MNESRLPAPLHGRLTVVRADQSADAAELAHRIALGLAGAAAADLDLRPTPGSVVTGAQLRAAAAARAAAAFDERAAARDAAVAHRTGLAARRTHLLERAQWCEESAATARALHATLDDAVAAVEAARAEVDAAAHRRDRVAEQRAAAKAAVDEARLELEGLDGASMDETGVRRELEAATRAEQEAATALADAEAEVAELQSRLDHLDAACADLAAERGVLLERSAAAAASADLEAAVVEALTFYDELADGAGPDPGAAALADALDRVERELDVLQATLPMPPTQADLDAAEADVAVARRNLDAARAASSSFDGPPPPWWEELTALHAEVADAEAALQTAGLRKTAARKRYEDALAAERARLDDLGFASYLDVLLSGGRLPGERTSENLAIAHATDALAGAERRLEQLRAARRDSAPLADMLDERSRLLETAVGLLGCDPGHRAVELLAEHPSVPPMATIDLADALRAAGVDTAGIGVAAAAREWLDTRAAAQDPGLLADVERRLADADAERTTVGRALESARTRVERAAAAHAAAGRAVTTLEAELRARAGEDGRLLERATAARALREQVEAVERRLADAEAEALEAWAATGDALAAAEAEHERVERELGDLQRRATRAAAELPPERRPAFDLLNGLVPLAGALRAEADGLADDLAAAEAAAMAAEHDTGDGPGLPTTDDLVAALGELIGSVNTAPSSPIIWSEPLEGVDPAAVEPVLAALAAATTDRPSIVVTADLAVVGWAIGLPADVGALLPARSLDHLVPAAPATPATHPVVD